MIVKIALLDWLTVLLGIMALVIGIQAVRYHSYILMLCAIGLAILLL